MPWFRDIEGRTGDAGALHRPAARGLDLLCAGTLFVAALWVFGSESHRLGIYADDASFFAGFPDLSLATMLEQARSYVTGRNLHIVWQYVIFLLTGNTIEALPAQHLIESVMVAVNCVGCYALFRLVGLPTLPVFLGVGLFAFLPNHPEASFWLTAIPQHLVSTFFVLLLAIGAIRTARVVVAGSRRAVGAMFAFDLCVFIAGLFTYDQVVLVMACIAVAPAVFCFFRRAELRGLAVLYGLACAGLFVAWAAWKVAVPSFGPSLSNASLFTVSRNFLFGVSLSVGPHFFRAFEPMLPSVFAEPADRIVALVVATSLFAVGLLGLMRPPPRPESNPSDFPGAFLRAHPVVMLAGIAAFFVLAYAPACLWFISGRHAYLPGIAVAAGFAWAAWCVTVALRRATTARTARLGGVLLLVVSCIVTFFFVGIVLAEKRDWIVSHLARQQMYAELVADATLRAASTLILEDFPDSVRPYSAPLGYQMPGEPAVMTRGRVKVRRLVQVSAPAQSGAFINVDRDRDGSEAFLYVPDEGLYRVWFHGLADGRIRYAHDDASPRAGYRLEEQAVDGSPPTAFRARRPVERPDAIELSLPAVALGPHEALAAAPLIATSRGLERMTMPGRGVVRRLVLADLSGQETGAGRRVLLTFDGRAADIAKLQLYVVGADGRRLLADLDVSATHLADEIGGMRRGP